MSSRVAVIGTGYVGLTTGAYLAHLGHDVVCADVIPDKVDALNRGEIPFFEVGLEEMVREGIHGGRLEFVLGAESAVPGAEFVFLCLPTPQSDDGSADMSFIESVATEIGPHLERYAVVVTKSTVPVGTTNLVARLLSRDDVYVVANPEFLREGTALHDCLHPDRIVIGSDSQEAAMRVAELFLHLAAPLIVTNPASAEAIKYASNAFLATKVSFINAIAQLCERFGADVQEVALGMGYDKRIGFEFLRPGPGFGGSCFPADETVLVRRSGHVRLLSFGALFNEVDQSGADGWEALAWRPGDPSPEFCPVAAFTQRPHDGELLTVTTKMGRRVRCTPDHPFVAGDGVGGRVRTTLAADLTPSDWLPVAQRFPVLVSDAWTAHSAGGWRAVGRRVRTGELRRLPDEIWLESEQAKRALLDGVSPGDRFEFSTASRELADGLARLLGDVGAPARVDLASSSLFFASLSALYAAKESKNDKNASWVRVTEITRERYRGLVYSVEVAGAHTLVTTFGLVAHNCFPKDSRALVRMADGVGFDFELLRSVVEMNARQFEWVVDKIESASGGSLTGKTVGVWGLTFKARTDDLRESPALHVIEILRARGATVRAFDPMVKHAIDGIEVCDDAYAACEGASVLAVLTEWEDFRFLDFDKVAAAMADKVVVDARNHLDPSALRRRGFVYDGIGRV